MSAFFDYVRGRSDELPAGYDERGMRLYRHLVWLGASQTIEAHHPDLREQLGEEAWRGLIEAWVRDSTWDSPFVNDLAEDFAAFLARTSA
ncbi:putative DNA-binding domain-containing protein [Ideonella sp. 4Y11]|uniref:DNA-binding domain-containing protein n=1 Tax=Ideonella aquatica TaxID=2824119 RepID=A0A940YP00_9BURK|nr:putative DNA-binding domain-containing protein [Ideonella aquatica]MBQ0959851.1 putative DNA-binding domain-containing protein [Ideonella aquatica]